MAGVQEGVLLASSAQFVGQCALKHVYRRRLDSSNNTSLVPPLTHLMMFPQQVLSIPHTIPTVYVHPMFLPCHTAQADTYFCNRKPGRVRSPVLWIGPICVALGLNIERSRHKPFHSRMRKTPKLEVMTFAIYAVSHIC